MNTKTNKQTFTENPFTRLIILVPLLIFIFVFFNILFPLKETAAAGNNHFLSAKSFILLIPIAFISAATLTMSFFDKIVVTCDSEGCEVIRGNFWRKHPEYASFRWSDVTNTNLVEQYVGKGVYVVNIEIEAYGQKTKLLSSIRYNASVFKKLLQLVNQSTPQLNYFWQKKKGIERHSLIREIRGFAKVSRI